MSNTKRAEEIYREWAEEYNSTFMHRFDEKWRTERPFDIINIFLQEKMSQIQADNERILEELSLIRKAILKL